MTAEIPELRCTVCDASLNRAGNLGEEERIPEPGNFTICLYCSHLLVFKDDLSLRDATEEEMAEAIDTTDIQEVLQMAKAFRERYKTHIAEMRRKRNN